MNKRSWGFTLIELVIVIAIIGVLVAIAVPAYKSSVIKSNRRAAQGFLMEVATRQNQYLLDRRRYAGSLADLGVTTPADVSRTYAITVTTEPGPPPSYFVEATPTAVPQTEDGVLRLTSAGTKSPPEKW